MSEKNASLSKWVTPEVPEQRVARMWSAIDEADRRRVWPRWAIASVALSAVLAVALVVSMTRPTVLQQGAEVASAAEPRVTRFADGSTAELGPASSLSLEKQASELVEVKLHAGRATFEVAKRPARQFVVKAHDVRVRVVGTRFTVNDTGGVVDVTVERGIVEVMRGGELVNLTAGQSWHSNVQTAAVVPPPSAAAIEDDDAEEDDAPAPATAAAAPKRVKRAKGKRIAAPAQSMLPAAAAEDAFQSALAARREGRGGDAAKGFEKFIREAPSDARAPVAAFELGRIRMDSLGDTRGAVEALRLSLKLDGRASFREEAMSRIVRGLDQLGDVTACQQARDSYLSAFPSGAYAHGVQTRCAGPGH